MTTENNTVIHLDMNKYKIFPVAKKEKIEEGIYLAGHEKNKPQFYQLGGIMEIHRLARKLNLSPAIILLGRYLEILLEGLLTRRLKIEKKQERESHRLSKVNGKKQRTESIKVGKLSLRFQVLTRDGFRCRYCGAVASDRKLVIDHIVPRSKGGGSNLLNYVTACEKCNAGKRDVLLVSDLKGKVVLAKEGQLITELVLGN